MRLDTILKRTLEIAERAAVRVARMQQDDLKVITKEDLTPVTAADLSSNRYLLRMLPLALPVAVVSEETPPARMARLGKLFWMVDPLDGTRDYIAKSSEYAINIALIQDGAPVLGVIARPSTLEIFYAVRGFGAFCRLNGKDLRLPHVLSPASTLLASRHHHDTRSREMAAHLSAGIVEMGSSLKFCALARGEAGVYPRFHRIHEWDVAAGHILVKEAGGRVVSVRGGEPTYGHGPYFLCEPFVATGPSVVWAREAIVRASLSA